jgi:hypothetical protein
VCPLTLLGLVLGAVGRQTGFSLSIALSASDAGERAPVQTLESRNQLESPQCCSTVTAVTQQLAC